MPDNVCRLKAACRYYDLDHYLFSLVTKRFEQEHTLNAFDFYAIIIWKSNRTKNKVRDGLKAANLSPSQLLKQVHDISDDREKMCRLNKVRGIGIPIASAILTVCYPDRFTVLDYRAWSALYQFKRVSKQAMPHGIKKYFDQYLPECTRLAKKMKMSLRETDKALWGWSQRQDIKKVART